MLRLVRAQAVRETPQHTAAAAHDDRLSSRGARQITNLTRMQLIRLLAAWRPDVSTANRVTYRVSSGHDGPTLVTHLIVEGSP